MAAELAREALALANGGAPAPTDEDGGPLQDIRRAAAADIASARVILARASSQTGAHEEAMPALEAAHAERPDDEPLLADLLRSEAVVRGPAAALERFERYRREVRERLGANPGEHLQRTHQYLLALDHPVRSGVRYDASALIGRDRDVEHLRALMASSRVVSIVGPGGLGKTRLAHVLARDGTVPIVHVVELVGVSSAEDVVGEVGSALGVRDSISGRRELTPEQRADVRARIAQRLGQSPSLVVLDNCEHLVEAVAELVAFLISTTAEVRVLTTSRAPLAIAAERVYLLGQLDVADAVQLFRERAAAARPTVRLNDDVGGQHRHAARRSPARDRAGCGQGAGHGGRGDRPATSEPLCPAARRRPQRTGPAPDAARGDRLVVEPARRRRTARAAPARPVPRWVYARGGACGARRRSGRSGAGPGRPIPAGCSRDSCRLALPDARDGAGVWAGCSSSMPARTARGAPLRGAGRSTTPAGTAGS